MASAEEAASKPNQEEGEGDGDGVASSLQQKRAAMLHRLAINDDARIQKFAARRAGSLASESPSESTDRFLQAFSDSLKQLEAKFSSLESRVSLEGTKGSWKSDLDLAAHEISELEQFVAESSYFLPAYEVRASLSSISNLREKLEAVNAELLPKKRFAFKKKAERERNALEEGAGKASQPAQALALEAAQPRSRIIDNSKASLAEETHHNQISGGADGFAKVPLPCAIRDCEGSVVVRDLKNQEDSEIILENLVNCRVYTRGICRAMYAHNLKVCKIYAGPVTGSALIEGVEDCTFMLASQQIRIHHAKKTDMYLRVRSRPIVEYTSDVRFAPYAFLYPGIADDLLAASLSEETGLWEHVDDFRWLRAAPSPNWCIVPETERALLEDGSAVLPGDN